MDDGRPSEFLKLDIDPKKYKRPFKRVEVSREIRKLIEEIQQDQPQWGPDRIAAHLRVSKGFEDVTSDHVLSVLTPEK